MSYILDALQRAEAERDRGRVPGLTSQRVPAHLVARERAAAPRLWRTVVGLIVTLAAVAAWWWAAGPREPQTRPISAPAPLAAPQTTSQFAAEPPVPARAPEQAAAPALPILAPVRPPTTPPAVEPAVRADVPTFGELSPEARAQLPGVNVSGSTWSKNPALRTLIANGKVVQEGQDIAPGLRLEAIGPRNAVLNHQGLRYSIGY
ncbi:general secretion pathway protein GspB [Hydrogenophaga sp.]|uniref:general secretion pathway protein GspB n=1 Tax=Hydrogenophaga sp. TaxID=1904254 RepID=UPI0025BA2ADA|nr:general secretion pathway protein GspB [Hydrogenophaga sp.]MBT9462564.1 general secretion pathway protein GspB [Hydrogenophaga sp.]